MTQKELLYLEDAVSHEKNIISICNDMIERFDDEELVEFMKNEVEIHSNTKEKLMDLMRSVENE